MARFGCTAKTATVVIICLVALCISVTLEFQIISRLSRHAREIFMGPFIQMDNVGSSTINEETTTAPRDPFLNECAECAGSEYEAALYEYVDTVLSSEPIMLEPRVVPAPWEEAWQKITRFEVEERKHRVCDKRVVIAENLPFPRLHPPFEMKQLFGKRKFWTSNERLQKQWKEYVDVLRRDELSETRKHVNCAIDKYDYNPRDRIYVQCWMPWMRSMLDYLHADYLM